MSRQDRGKGAGGKKSIRKTAAVLAGKATGALSRVSGRGGGTTLPGDVARAIDPRVLAKLASDLTQGSVVITGTNGKTTTARLITWLLEGAEPRKLWPAWRLDGEALAEGKRDATLLVLKLQEDAGIDIVSDGEQSRQHFVHGFLEGVEGIDFARQVPMGIRNNRYEAMVPTVTGPLRRKGPVHAEEARIARAHTTRRLKFTLPGPMTIIDTIADAHYGDRVAMAMAFAELLNEEARELAAIGVDVIQFDEPAFNVYLDEVTGWGNRCATLRDRGPDVQDRGAYLLRLRHPGQRRMEGDARGRVAAIRAHLPGPRGEPDRPNLARMRPLACADRIAGVAGGQGRAGRRD